MFRTAAFITLLLTSPFLLAETEIPKFERVNAELVRPRNGLGNVLAKLVAGEPVKIADLGGSITAAPGRRVKTRCKLYTQRLKAYVRRWNRPTTTAP